MAWQQVWQNAGSAGIDRMTVEVFERRKEKLLALIHKEFKASISQFKPARGVLIAKKGSAKMRKLGISAVMVGGS